MFEILSENGLGDFYGLAEAAGVRVQGGGGEGAYRFLDEPAVLERLADFTDGRQIRVTFHVPAIHCIACVWLLEQLFRLKDGIGSSRVNFPRKEVAIAFAPAQVKLSQVVALLASLGYEPELRFSDLDRRPAGTASRRLWLQLGVAGFAFGNTMLFSISSYLGLDAVHGAELRRMFGYLSLLLALPVFVYSASDYWRTAWVGWRRRVMNLEMPIAAGLLALFSQSVFEVLTGRGEGYFDSLCGLIFFLLCGRLFQRKTYERLSFDRGYKAFFPLAVTRRRDGVESRVALSQLVVGDRLVLRHGELIPADARLVSGPALVDYSFVTGEAAPVPKRPGDYLYAGGRQMGAAIEVEVLKAVSQGYLASLWNQDLFRKEKGDTFDTLTNRYSRRFTKVVLGIALGAALFWSWQEPGRAIKAFISVLIVACPCALALAAPFALGSAQRALGRRDVFLKNAGLLETLARVDAVVFDKTGTLTGAGAGPVTYSGKPLRPDEEAWVAALCRHSIHPYAVRVGQALNETLNKRGGGPAEPVRSFVEKAGCGMEGGVAGHEIRVGSAAWLIERGVQGLPADTGARVTVEDEHEEGGGRVEVAVDRAWRGTFVLRNKVRPETGRLVRALGRECELALLSGDNERERARFLGLFGPGASLHFNQGPADKLGFIRRLQEEGRVVMMVGDGLNDAGALQQSEVGVAVVESVGAFSPASDVILRADMLPQLPEILAYARSAVRVVRLSFLISSLYNVAGVSIAASGRLSPLVCAILMPLSSATVALFACGATQWLGRRLRPEIPKGGLAWA